MAEIYTQERAYMSQEVVKFIWRCINCSNHFANITKTDGALKQEKKCPKCKAQNIITLTNKDIIIHCKLYDPSQNGYIDNYQDFPDMR